MTSSNKNIFRVIGPLCGEFTGPSWIPLTKASYAELWYFLWFAPWKNGWFNDREAVDLKGHRAPNDAIVMYLGNSCNRYPISCPLGRDVECLLLF